MTQLLAQAMDQVHRLSPSEQDAIATIILDELADEERWSAAFAESQDQLAKLAEKARQDVRAGHFREMGFDEL